MSDQIDTMVQAEINRRRAGAEAAEREAIRAELERQVELAALDRKNREQLARVTADGEQAMRLRSASRAPSGTPMAANGSAAPGEPQDTTEAASEAELARLEKRRAAAREYPRRKRAEQRAEKSKRRCAECCSVLPATAGKGTRFCSRICRNTSSRRATRARLAGPPPVGETWPPRWSS